MESDTFASVGTVLCRDGRRYWITAHLTEGRHGPICMVRNAFGRRFVGKCFRITEPDASAFKREARALEALRHPNVVHLYDTVTDESRQWLILEPCHINLGGWIDEVGRAGARHFTAIASGLLQALDCIHSCGFMHGDVRPRNVLLLSPDQSRLTRPPIVKLTDFGESSALGSGAAGEGPKFSGGWIYPPETLDPARFGRPDHRTDLFLCALVLLSVLRGSVVNLTREEAAQGKALAFLHEIDDAWAPALARALDLFPVSRYASALAFWEELSGVAQKLREPISDGASSPERSHGPDARSI